ncbi:signal peptidase I [Hominenteromicrobium sp.]|nr:signal peptidase I [Acutalibacteraceae bacterium]
MEKVSNNPPMVPAKGVKTLYEWLEEIVIALTLVILVFTFLFRVVTVTGESMLPNFVEGQKLIVTNLGHSVEQGTVVVITNVLNEPIIKRVIATEGQTVDIDYETGVVYVDGKAVDETQFGLENGITTRPYSTLEAMVFPQTVPEGCVFVLGDNRSVSKDSRYTEVGMVDTRHILGEAVFTLYPFDRFGVIE